MQLIVERFCAGGTYTLGRLKNNNKHMCFTMEDPYQAQKIQGNTRIPAGKYELVLRAEGGKYRQYLDRFGVWQKPGMLWVKDVPGFEWILIHPGNTAKDTEGCLLVGMGFDWRGQSVTDSVTAYTEVYSEIEEALTNGVRVTIEYIDNDR